MTDSITQIFTVAVLLTGSESQAEAAVNRAIDSSGCDRPAILLQRTVEWALKIDKRGEQETCLPLELRRLFQIEANFRRPFVLRTLLGWSRDKTAALLGIADPAGVDFLAGEAAARIAMAPVVQPDPSVELLWAAAPARLEAGAYL